MLNNDKKFTDLKLFLATETHNFNWVNITYICFIWDQTFGIFKNAHLAPNNCYLITNKTTTRL